MSPPRSIDYASEERAATVTVMRRAKVGPVTVLEDPGDEEVMEAHVFQGEPAFIEVDLKVTENVVVGRASNFISASIKMAVPVYVEEMEDVAPGLGSYARKRIAAELDALRTLVINETDPRTAYRR